MHCLFDDSSFVEATALPNHRWSCTKSSNDHTTVSLQYRDGAQQLTVSTSPIQYYFLKKGTISWVNTIAMGSINSQHTITLLIAPFNVPAEHLDKVKCKVGSTLFDAVQNGENFDCSIISSQPGVETVSLVFYDSGNMYEISNSGLDYLFFEMGDLTLSTIPIGHISTSHNISLSLTPFTIPDTYWNQLKCKIGESEFDVTIVESNFVCTISGTGYQAVSLWLGERELSLNSVGFWFYDYVTISWTSSDVVAITNTPRNALFSYSSITIPPAVYNNIKCRIGENEFIANSVTDTEISCILTFGSVGVQNVNLWIYDLPLSTNSLEYHFVDKGTFSYVSTQRESLINTNQVITVSISSGAIAPETRDHVYCKQGSISKPTTINGENYECTLNSEISGTFAISLYAGNVEVSNAPLEYHFFGTGMIDFVDSGAGLINTNNIVKLSKTPFAIPTAIAHKVKCKLDDTEITTNVIDETIECTLTSSVQQSQSVTLWYVFIDYC